MYRVRQKSIPIRKFANIAKKNSHSYHIKVCTLTVLVHLCSHAKFCFNIHKADEIVLLKCDCLAFLTLPNIASTNNCVESVIVIWSTKKTLRVRVNVQNVIRPLSTPSASFDFESFDRTRVANWPMSTSALFEMIDKMTTITININKFKNYILCNNQHESYLQWHHYHVKLMPAFC